MFTKIKNWLKALFVKEVTAPSAPARELGGWDRYYQMMSTVSTGLEAKVGETVNEQITDAVTQAGPKKKKSSTKPAPKMSAKPAQAAAKKPAGKKK